MQSLEDDCSTAQRLISVLAGWVPHVLTAREKLFDYYRQNRKVRHEMAAGICILPSCLCPA